jgi:hypothetical protein
MVLQVRVAAVRLNPQTAELVSIIEVNNKMRDMKHAGTPFYS